MKEQPQHPPHTRNHGQPDERHEQAPHEIIPDQRSPRRHNISKRHIRRPHQRTPPKRPEKVSIKSSPNAVNRKPYRYCGDAVSTIKQQQPTPDSPKTFRAASPRNGQSAQKVKIANMHADTTSGVTAIGCIVTLPTV